MPPLISALTAALTTLGGGSALTGALTAGSLAATGIGLGEQLANQPGGGPKAAPAAAAAPTGPPTSQILSAATPQALTIESLTGGSVSPEYLSTVAPLLAGVAGQPNTPSAMAQLLKQLGLGGSGSTGGTSSIPSAPFTPSGTPTDLRALGQSPGLSDFLSKLSVSLA